MILSVLFIFKYKIIISSGQATAIGHDPTENFQVLISAENI